MSRTDKTAPYAVKMLYYPSWVEEYHNHEGRDCDLPEKATHDNIGWSGFKTCCWVASNEFYASGMSNCPCLMCHRYYGWKDDREPKRVRRSGRRYVRDGWRDEY